MRVGVYLSWNDGWCVDSTWRKISHVQVVVIKGPNKTFRAEKSSIRALRYLVVGLKDEIKESSLSIFSVNASASLVRTQTRTSDDVFLSQDAPSVAGLPIGMDVPGSKPLWAPHLSETFQTVEPTSVALIEELRRAKDVEDLPGQDVSSVPSLRVGMDVPASKPLSALHLPEAFQIVDPTSAVLIEKVRPAIDIEDLTDQ